MRRHLDPNREKEHRLEMTPMIDVTFLLLIFFMCTLKFKTLEGLLNAYLPDEVGQSTKEAERIEKVEILVRVIDPGTPLRPDREGPAEEGKRFVFDDDRVLEYQVGPFRTRDFDSLEEKLRTVHAARKDEMPLDAETGERKPVPAVIVPGRDTIHEDVMDVLDVLLDAGFVRVNFAGAVEG